MAMLHNIKEVSVYAQPSKIMPTEECVTVLFNGVLYECSKVPFVMDCIYS